MSLSADPSITDGVVCANQDVHFTCQMLGIQHVEQYLWLLGHLKIGQQKETYNIPSSLISINVTCVIYAHVNNRSISESSSVLLSIGKATNF